MKNSVSAFLFGVPLAIGLAHANSLGPTVRSNTPSFCELHLGEAAPASASLIRAWTKNPEESGVIEFREYRVCNARASAIVSLDGTVIDSIEIDQLGICVDGTVCIGSELRKAQNRFPEARLFMSQEGGRVVSLRVTNWLSLSYNIKDINDACWRDATSCKGVIEKAKLRSIFLSTFCMAPNSCVEQKRAK